MSYRKLYVVLLICLILVCSFSLIPKGYADYPVEELVPGMDYGSWFQSNTGYTPNADWFGAWVFESMGGKLYIGFGPNRPVVEDGALLASYDGNDLEAIYMPTEQGIHDMTAVNGTLYIAGTDPAMGDNWDWGNIYTYTPPGEVIKHRNIPSVVHTWGVWVDLDGTVYVTTHGGGSRIFRSIDNCESWELIYDFQSIIEDGWRGWMAYDVIRFNNNLYVTEYTGSRARLFKSEDNGNTWVNISQEHKPHYRPRMIVYNDKVLTVSSNRDRILAFDSIDNVSEHILPGVINEHAFNVFAIADDGFLYVVFNNGKVYRTENLDDWELIASIGKDLITIGYWPDEDWIVVSERGADARLWKIDLNNKLNIILKGLAIDDNSENGTYGNVDGIINAGECIGLNITLQNLSYIYANYITGILSLQEENPQITILQDMVYLGDITSGSTVTSDEQFIIEFDTELLTALIPFKLTLTDANGQEWFFFFDFMVYNPSTTTMTTSWGSNYYSQLGDNSRKDRLTPVLVRDSNDIVAIAGGYYHSLALKNDGTVWAWGYNDDGQLGDGTTIQRNTPVQVLNLDKIIAISAGTAHSFALKDDGTAWSWGYNIYGQLGDGTTIQRNTPVQVLNLDEVVAIAGGYYHSLALKSDGTVWAWGRNSGRFGDGTTTDSYTPVQALIEGIVAIAAGLHSSFALKDDGTAWSWGSNTYGQLGDGTTSSKYTPVRVLNLDGVAVISAGSYHSLALKSDGAVWSWGYNGYGQLGDGTTTNGFIPSRVLNSEILILDKGLKIAAGGCHSLAVAIVSPPLPPDLSIKTISFSNSTPKRFDTIKVNVEVTNEGEKTSGNFTVEWYIDGELKEITEVLTGINGGESTTITYSWNITGDIGCREIETRILTVPRETNTENNIRKRHILVDLDGDGDIDIVDIMLVAAHWDTQEGDPDYEPIYDMDGDGDITIIDVMKVANLWRIKCPD